MSATSTKPRTIVSSDTIIEEFLNGMWPERIAHEYHITEARVTAALVAEGYTAHRHKYPADEIQGWVDRYTGKHDGTKWSIAEISRRMYHRRKVKPAYGTIAMRLMERLGKLRHPIQAMRLAHKKRRNAKNQGG